MTTVIPHRHLEDPALRHAHTDFVRIRHDQTVGEALQSVRDQKPVTRIVYFYAIDEEGRLRGVAPTRRLLLSRPETPVADIMVTEVITLPKDASLADACEWFILHRLLAFPIVDEQQRLLGVVDVEVYTDEISELARRDEADDVFQLIGVRLAQVRQAAVRTVVARRFPWLLCNMGGGMACAVLAAWYADILDRLVVLSLFIPVVLAMAESVSIQSLSLTLQAQHDRRAGWSDLMPILWREFRIALLLGLGCGGLVAGAALVWHRLTGVALTLLFAISLAVTTGALLGLFVPTALRGLHRDPRIASGPIVLATTDVATLFYYLGMATWVLA